MPQPLPMTVKAQRVLVAAVLVVLAIRAAAVPLFTFSIADYPLDYVIAEGDQLVYLHRLLHGETIYSDSTGFPLIGNVYPPVFPTIMWLAGHVFPPTLAMLRLLSLVPLFGSMLLIGLFLKRAGAPKALIAAGVLLLPCCYSSAQFLTYVRCDGWMAMFALASLYCLTELPEATSRASTGRIVLGALFAALALFTKQTALIGVAAVLLHLVISRWRQGLLAIAATGIFCGAFLGLSLWRFGPVMLDAMFFLTVRRTFEAERFGALLMPEVTALAVVIVVSAVRMVTHIVKRKWDMLDTYIVAHSAVIGLVLYDCSGTNYFLPAYLGFVLATVLSVHDLLQASWRRERVLAGAAAMLALQLFLQHPYSKVFEGPTKDEWAEARRAAEFLQAAAGPVYCERFWAPVADRPSTLRYFVEPTHMRTLPPDRLPLLKFTEPFREKKFERMLIYYPQSFHYDGFCYLVTQFYRVERVAKLRVCFGQPWNAEVAYLVRKE
ncbi:MAG TPA: hypothetical protein VGP72_28950 [Planctomycetota bacterium]|jgi:hypothetical protein